MTSIDRDEATDCEPGDLGFWRGLLLAMPLCLAVWGLLLWWVLG